MLTMIKEMKEKLESRSKEQLILKGTNKICWRNIIKFKTSINKLKANWTQQNRNE